MPDITMCKGTNCPQKEQCYRFTAKANDLLQSYFVEPPIKDDKCDMYWDNEIKNKLNDTQNNKHRRLSANSR